MPTAYILVGLPGVGKSTYHKTHIKGTVISSDDMLEGLCKAEGITYDEGFDKLIKPAIKAMNIKADKAIKDKQDIVWDQTNLSRKSRQRVLARLGKDYHKICVVFATPEEKEHDRRLNNREGKTIPENIMRHMKLTYDPPVLGEGFNVIVQIKDNKVKQQRLYDSTSLFKPE